MKTGKLRSSSVQYFGPEPLAVSQQISGWAQDRTDLIRKGSLDTDTIFWLGGDFSCENTI